MTTIRYARHALTVAAGLLVLAPDESQAQKRQRDRITREEILASAHVKLDIYQVIRSLRPHFLDRPPGVRSLGGATQAPLAVYVGRTLESGVDALRTIMASSVEEVRYLQPSRAESEFGINANGGAVVLTLIKAPRASPRARDTTEPLSR